ncbi:MAG: helix-turn-helix domain-containing protein [Candidatus Kapabacteria bacterium]|jgi:excisionase family DNA binding protein|nr:helix-turn-helix domain-containing protein [Candidatus Kapabacteria bacterium]
MTHASVVIVPLEELQTMMTDIVNNAVRNIVPDRPTSLTPDEDYLTREETAKMLRISLQGLTKYMSEGRVPFHKLGRRTLFKRSEVEKAISKQKPHGNRTKAAAK